MGNRIPAELFPPGEYIRDELEARGWTQLDLAQILGRPANAVSQIIAGKRSITPEMAKGLGAAFGTSAEMWMNLESAYQLAQAKSDDDEVSKRSEMFAIAPVGEMIRRGWIKPSSDVKEMQAELLQFFEVDDLANVADLPMAARKSGTYEETNIQQRAWGYRVRRLSRTVDASKYNAAHLRDGLAQLRAMTQYPENVREVPKLLAGWGVRLVLAAHLEKTKIDGVAMWVDGNPVVGLSLRYDRIDSFWFTLVHELLHILNGDAAHIDSNIVADPKGQVVTDLDEIERLRNKETCEILVEPTKLESFITRVSPLYSTTKVIQFGQANNVHPGIVLGQLQKRKEIHWSKMRELLVPVRQLIVGSAMTDGWGYIPGSF